jgi:predicted ester cyclase
VKSPRVLGGLVAVAVTVLSLVSAPSVQARDRVHPARPIEVSQRFYAAVDARPYDPAAVAGLFAESYRDHHRPVSDPTFSDKQVITGVLDALAVGFPDGRHRVYLLQRVGPDKVLAYWTFTGTNTGPLFGAPPTGRRVEIDGTDLLRIRHGRIVEQWHIEELQKLSQQLAAAS